MEGGRTRSGITCTIINYVGALSQRPHKEMDCPIWRFPLILASWCLGVMVSHHLPFPLLHNEGINSPSGPLPFWALQPLAEAVLVALIHHTPPLTNSSPFSDLTTFAPRTRPISPAPPPSLFVSHISSICCPPSASFLEPGLLLLHRRHLLCLLLTPTRKRPSKKKEGKKTQFQKTTASTASIRRYSTIQMSIKSTDRPIPGISKRWLAQWNGGNAALSIVLWSVDCERVCA